MALQSTRLEPAWIVTCACGWNVGGKTLEEIRTAVDAHEAEAVQGTLHSVAITGRLEPRRPAPSSRSAR